MMDKRSIPWWESMLPKTRHQQHDDYFILWESLEKDVHSLFGLLTFENKNWVLDVPTRTTSDYQQQFQRIYIPTESELKTT